MAEIYIRAILKNKQNRYEHITKREREIISKHLSAGRRISYIAKALNRSKSIISEEIKRGWYKGKYVPSIANERSLAARKKSHEHTKWRNTELQHFILMFLKEKWSPEIIAHTWNEQHPDYTISHTFIYDLIENHRREWVKYLIYKGRHCRKLTHLAGRDYIKNRTDMSVKQRKDLARDIAELLYAIHNIPLSEVNKVIEQYSKVCRDEKKTNLTDFNYSIAREQLLECSCGKLDLDIFKTEVPTDGLALCHNDLHAENIIINDCGKLSGFIDFGEAGINPRITDFFHLYRLDRMLMINIIDEYNKISDYKIDKQATDYQFLSNTGYTLEKRKNRASFKSEVAKVLQKNVFLSKSPIIL